MTVVETWQLMMMALNGVLGLAIVLGMFILRHIWTTLSELRVADDNLAEKIGMMKSTIEENFVRSASLRDALAPMREQLGRIESKLDRKVDRNECQRFHVLRADGPPQSLG